MKNIGHGAKIQLFFLLYTCENGHLIFQPLIKKVIQTQPISS